MFSHASELYDSLNYLGTALMAVFYFVAIINYQSDKVYELNVNLDPKEVIVHEEGMYLETWSFFVECDGLFVLPPGSTFDPSNSGDPAYKRIEGRLYYYKVVG